MSHGRWTESLSAEMRAGADTAADRCLAELLAAGGLDSVHAVFRAMPGNHSQVPADAPEPLQRFFASQMSAPAWTDAARIRQGERVFLRNGLPIAVVLTCKSIPEGYGAPALTRVLALTGLLEGRPLRRLLGVLQMVLDVAMEGGFEPQGRALRTAAQLRLLHAGLRPLVRKALPDYEAQHGVPCNHEDMLATVMGFSLLVVDGLQRLGAHLTPTEAEDLFYPWRVFCACMGLPAQYIPVDLGDARNFYKAYGERQYAPAAANPEGVRLAQANTRMLRALLPSWSHHLGLAQLPEVYMWLLMEPEDCQRVGIAPVDDKPVLKRLAVRAAQMTALSDRSRRRQLAPIHQLVAQRLFLALIQREYRGAPAILVPTRLADVWRI